MLKFAMKRSYRIAQMLLWINGVFTAALVADNYKIPDSNVTLHYVVDATAQEATITGATFTDFTPLHIPDTLGGYPVTGITSYAFAGYRYAITSLRLPSGLTRIEDNTFIDCNYLLEVELNEGLESIGYRAFYDCDAVETITLPRSVVEIGDSAFQGSDELLTVTFEGNAPASFGVDVFADCNSSFAVYYYTGATGFETDEGSQLWKGYRQRQEDYWGAYEVPGTNATLSYLRTGDPAHVIIKNCSDDAVGEIIIPSELDGFPVTVIGDHAFEVQRYITGITLPNTIIEIGLQAFALCDDMTRFVVPASVDIIRDAAFIGTWLTEWVFEGDLPATFGEGNFLLQNPDMVVVYYEDAEGFSSPMWNDYKTVELELEDTDGDGWPDLIEQALGTDPLKDSDHLEFRVDSTGNTLQLHYAPHSAALDFTLWRTTDLSDPDSWQPVTDLTFSDDATGRSTTAALTGAAPVFYRLEVER